MRIPSNKILDIERFAYSELENIYPKNEIRCFLAIMFEYFLGWNQTTWLLSKQKTINQSDLLKINFAIKDLKNYKPIQYIIGETTFCGLPFFVDENVLIPRPETEDIVNKYVDKNFAPKKILDLCTGSACIAVALAKKFPQSKITAVDISKSALKVAQKNAHRNSVEINFQNIDIRTESKLWSQKFDLLVSNPPYVRNSEKKQMHNNVLDYEPHIALFVDDNDPLVFYRHIANIAAKTLNKNGKFVVEINETLSLETNSLFEKHGFDTMIHKDFFEKPRFITGIKR